MALQEQDVHVEQVSPGVVVVEFRGEHDLATKEETVKLLHDLITHNELVVVDVSETEFIDSSFIHGIVLADREARANGTRFRLQIATAAMVESVLNLSGVLQIVDVARSRHEALAGNEPATPDV